MTTVWLQLMVVVVALATVAVAPPPRQPPPPLPEPEQDIGMSSETLGLEYRNYLEQIVKTLEEDEQFKTILQNSTDDDIKSGSVAEKLHVVDPSIRSKLDELKRIELERLRKRATEQYELSNGLDPDAIREPLHLEHRNPHTFREEDLKKLIHKTTRDLDDLDKQRRDDFKKYEMEKEFKYQEDLKSMDEEHKKEAEKKHVEELEKKKQHPKSQVHHPLSEDQLEEVWEDQDHMDKQDFDPITFFRMHDLDGNEVLDQMEVMALFKHELDKIYNGTDYDQKEREEEMNEMRETTYNEVDTDRDGFISLKEFIASTKHDDYERDQGWEGIGEREQYEKQEYEEYERRRAEEIQRQINMGLMPPPHTGYQMPPGYGGQPGQGQPPLAPAGFVPPHLAGQTPPGMGAPQQGGAQPQPGMGHPGMAQPQPGMVQQHPGMVQPQPGMVQQHPGMVQPQPGMVQPHPGMAQPQPGMVQPHPGMAQPQPGMVQPHPGMIQPQPGMVQQQQPGMVQQQQPGASVAGSQPQMQLQQAQMQQQQPQLNQQQVQEQMQQLIQQQQAQVLQQVKQQQQAPAASQVPGQNQL